MKDIATENDVKLLVNSFYSKLVVSKPIDRHFTDLDLDKHLPNVVSFWCLILLDIAGYKNNTSEKHSHLAMNNEDFDIWIRLFNESVQSLFIGPIATKAMQRAEIIAFTLKSKFVKI